MHRSKRILDEFIHSPIVPAYRMYNIIFFISNAIYVTFGFNSSQKIATHFGWSISILYCNSIQFNLIFKFTMFISSTKYIPLIPKIFQNWTIFSFCCTLNNVVYFFAIFFAEFPLLNETKKQKQIILNVHQFGLICFKIKINNQTERNRSIDDWKTSEIVLAVRMCVLQSATTVKVCWSWIFDINKSPIWRITNDCIITIDALMWVPNKNKIDRLHAKFCVSVRIMPNKVTCIS